MNTPMDSWMIVFAVLAGVDVVAAILIPIVLHKTNKIKKQLDNISRMVQDYLDMILEEDEKEERKKEEQIKLQREREQNQLISSVLQEIFS